MENTNHWLDDDFEKINSLFEEYASSVNFQNIEDFRSAVKTKLTNQVWKTLYKISKNRSLMEENAADFVEALNDCIKANLNKKKNGTMSDPFSKYVYNTIPRMLKSAANKEKATIEHITYSKEKIKNIRDIIESYEYLKKCGVTEHNKIIKKIAVMKEMSEVEVEKYYALQMSDKTSIDQQYDDSDESYDILSEEAGKQKDYSSPENDYLFHSDIVNVFESINKEWKNIKQKKNESASDYKNRKQMMSELLTVFILKEYHVSYEKRAEINSFVTSQADFDISKASEKYDFFNNLLVDNFIKSENRKLPALIDIAHKYFPELKKDTLSHKLERFIEKAVEKLK